MKLSEKALWLAQRAHMGQTRKDKKTPYIVHPEAVAELTKLSLEVDAAKLGFGYDDFPVNEVYVAAAYLHDVIEDTNVTADKIYDELIAVANYKYVEATVGAVKALTKTPGEDYMTYLKRVKSNHFAARVKKYDLRHNLSDLKPGKLREKYLLAYYYLTNETV